MASLYPSTASLQLLHDCKSAFLYQYFGNIAICYPVARLRQWFCTNLVTQTLAGAADFYTNVKAWYLITKKICYWSINFCFRMISSACSMVIDGFGFTISVISSPAACFFFLCDTLLATEKYWAAVSLCISATKSRVTSKSPTYLIPVYFHSTLGHSMRNWV